jgi:hypothetical protein
VSALVFKCDGLEVIYKESGDPSIGHGYRFTVTDEDTGKESMCYLSGTDIIELAKALTYG